MTGNHTQTMDTVDKFILALYQDTADLIQKIFGVDNFMLAKLALFIQIPVYFFLTWVLDDYKFNPINIIFILIMALYLTLFYRMITDFEHMTRKHGNMYFKNPAVIKLEFLRGVWLIFLSISIFYLLRSLFLLYVMNYNEKELLSLYLRVILDFLVVSMAYFASCTPKPPTKSKVTQLMEKLVQLLQPEPEPSGI